MRASDAVFSGPEPSHEWLTIRPEPGPSPRRFFTRVRSFAFTSRRLSVTLWPLDVHIHSHTHNELLAERGPVLVRVLDGVVTDHESIDNACALFDRMLERYKTIACMAIVEHGTPVPTLAVRRYTIERFSGYGERLVSCVVFLGLGFWAKAAYDATTMFLRVAGSTTLIDTSLAGMSTRLSQELIGLDPDALALSCEELRRKMRAL